MGRCAKRTKRHKPEAWVAVFGKNLAENAKVPVTSTNQLGFDALNAALKAAGEETRLRVLALLSEAELTVSDLTDILRQSQPRISRHLKLLAEAGLIERFREGTWAFFRLSEQGGGAEVARAMLARLNPADPTIARDRDRLPSGRQGAGPPPPGFVSG